MSRISLFDAGRVLAKERLWSAVECEGQKESVKYEDFWKACVINDLTTYDRKIKELWKGFQMMGVAKPANQYSTLIFDLEKFRTMMAVHYDEWRVKA